ncbi:MAG TPA: hypothetical protein VEI83_04880 [Acidimicrobiales bacterium]|nr:hypothetical protein [Acidimicrobiales bacterium]
MSVTPLRWTEEPLVVAPVYLRWALLHGLVGDTARWVLREGEGSEARWHLLDVKEAPTPEDLVSELAPTTGLPIAEALIDEAKRRLPDSIFCSQ